MGGGNSGLNNSGSKKEREVEKKARDLEETIRDLEHEEGFIMDRDGKILQRASGNEDTVVLDAKLSKDAITSHNHPDLIMEDGRVVHGCVFSPEDLIAMSKTGEWQMRETNSMFTHVLTRIRDSSMAGQFAAKYQEFYDKTGWDKTSEWLKGQISAGKIRDTDADYAYHGTLYLDKLCRTWLKNNAERYGYKYNEYRRKKK